jgi:hypothetical protein
MTIDRSVTVELLAIPSPKDGVLPLQYTRAAEHT